MSNAWRPWRNDASYDPSSSEPAPNMGIAQRCAGASSGWARWVVTWLQRVLHRVGQFQAAVLLSLIYLVCWVPVGMLSRLRADWLRRRAPAGSAWRPRAERINQPDHVHQSF